MSQIYTFGVEIEALYTWCKESEVPVGTDTSKLIVLSELTKAERRKMIVNEIRNVDEQRVRDHIRKTMFDAGLPVDLEPNLFAVDITKWDIKSDVSIDPIEYTGDDDSSNGSSMSAPTGPLRFAGVEVVSPAMKFSQVSLDQVIKLCDLLNDKYDIMVNITCGIHVHVGHHLKGEKGYSFIDLQKLFVLLYTFEPQLSSLHPPSRFQATYTKQLRHCCWFNHQYQKKHDRLPLPSEFAHQTFEYTDRGEWFKYHVADIADPRQSTYNMTTVIRDVKVMPEGQTDMNALRQTIEFRQHSGSADATGITQWIKTVIGIVEYAEKGDPAHFHDLITTAWRAERWEKIGTYNGVSDADRAKEMGTALEDEGFTVIDFLMGIGLKRQAKYYRDKRYVHEIPRGKSRKALYLSKVDPRTVEDDWLPDEYP